MTAATGGPARFRREAEGAGRPEALLDEELDAGLPRWALPQLLHRIGSVARYDSLTFERQIPFTFVYLVGLLLLLTDTLRVEYPQLLLASLCLVALHLALAGLLPWPRMPEWTKLLLPMLQMEGAALLWLTVAEGNNLYGLLVVLPMVGFGLLPGRFGVWVGAVLAFGVGLVPVARVVNEGEISPTTILAALYLPLVAATVALAVNEVTRRLRRRTEALMQLRVAQNAMLVRARQDAAQLARTTEEVRITRDLWASVLNAATRQAIMATDADGTLELFNPGAEALLGYSRERMVGRDVSVLFEPGEVDRRRQENDDAQRPIDVIVAGTRTGGWDVRDWTLVRADGEQRRSQVAITVRAPLEGADGGYVLVATDVTDEREAARLKDEFVSLVSHELRTPISSVLGYVELLNEGEGGETPTPEQAGYLDVIERNARRLLRLVGDLLLSAQMDAGRFHVNPEPMDLGELVDDAVVASRPLARTCGVTVQWHRDGVLAMAGDRGRLAQVADNLISNALKFTPRGGTVTVDVGPARLAGRVAVRLRVQDTGIGIPPDEVEHLFERFFRSTSAARKAIPGVGLGLPVTKAIVEAHGGEIGVRSEVGTGTVFTVVLPTRPGPSPEPGDGGDTPVKP